MTFKCADAFRSKSQRNARERRRAPIPFDRISTARLHARIRIDANSLLSILSSP